MTQPILLKSTQTGSNQFSLSSAVFDFTDTFDSLPDRSFVVIQGYGYNAPSSAAHDANLYIAPSAAADADERLVLEERTGINSFTNACGSGGVFLVPKSSAGDTYVVLFETSGKDADGTLQVWYTVETF